MHSFTAELNAALFAVRQASHLCRAVQNTITPDVLDKKDNSPVTIADFGSQALVCRAIGDAFAHDPIIAEEDSAALRQPEQAGFLEGILNEVHRLDIHATPDDLFSWIDRGNTQQYSSRFWTLDPIDGTKGFLRKGQYAVSLALIVNGRIELGVLGCPNLPVSARGDASIDMICYAVRGHGAFMVPLEGDDAAWPIRVSNVTDPKLARFCESVESGHSAHDDSVKIANLLGLTAPPVRMDSQAKYATVGQGRVEAYLRLPTRKGYFERIWDHAGGVILVEEAGGRVTDLNGNPLDFTHGHTLLKNRGVIVTNGLLHDEVLDAVKSVVPNEQ
jgi:3'(2'), 5'-bisphosphate nucleotidase